MSFHAIPLSERPNGLRLPAFLLEVHLIALLVLSQGLIVIIQRPNKSNLGISFAISYQQAALLPKALSVPIAPILWMLRNLMYKQVTQ
jgi:hypothetical protein